MFPLNLSYLVSPLLLVSFLSHYESESSEKVGLVCMLYMSIRIPYTSGNGRRAKQRMDRNARVKGETGTRLLYEPLRKDIHKRGR